jgi:20S proteasome subunit alpha 7
MSKMLIPGSNRRIFGLDAHAGMAITGYAADGRQIVHRARDEAQNYKETYGHAIIPSVLANRLALYMHYFTIHGSLRPFGSTAILAAYDEDVKSAELYMMDPAGLCMRYFGCAAGKGAQAAKTELEKILSKRGSAGISCAEAVNELATILYTIRDPSKDKPFELEMGWLCEGTGWKHSLVPAELVAAADERAKQAVTGVGGGVAGGGGGGAGEEKTAMEL